MIRNVSLVNGQTDRLALPYSKVTSPNRSLSLARVQVIPSSRIMPVRGAFDFSSERSLLVNNLVPSEPHTDFNWVRNTEAPGAAEFSDISKNVI
jgi:hypothetical protein